jgi:hypothetical protein
MTSPKHATPQASDCAKPIPEGPYIPSLEHHIRHWQDVYEYSYTAYVLSLDAAAAMSSRETTLYLCGVER